MSDYRKHRYGLADEPKKTTQENFYKQKASSQSNHGLKKIAAHKFRTRLGSKQYDITKEKSVLMIIKINLKEKTCKHNILC